MRIKQWLTDRIEWLRAADLRLAAELIGVGILILAFAKIGSEVLELEPGSFDDAILLALRNTPEDPLGPRWVEVSVMHLSALGSGAVTTLIVLVAATFLWLGGHWKYALVVCGSAVVTVVSMALLKGLYERPRPTVVVGIDLPESLSFPSGHSMISAALFPTLAVLIARTLDRRRQRVFVVAAGAFLAMLVGFSRVYLGVHYPTDVLAGWLLGMAIALVCGVVIRRLGRKVDAPPPSQPG